ncbi:TPR-like protein [Dacryopinax primogenitus]|uniref:TPR-like protein n=1 Tax=Dacryopinax primogenitus (strain DJM 731) TaxID=1858805 RepID=M5FS60_DACPD|nr:TPR-like protein [Dacryopinax primogenitus]EJT97979.1 TPR-like protein [Dacryopinax primogenitus]
MSAKKYQEAIDAYTSSIALDGTNPVYFSNRAAAYSSLGDHNAAAEDAERALAADPKFSKAYSRLGHARYSMKQYAKAADAFRKGLVLDPSNANMKSGLENAEARVSEGADEDDEDEDPRQTAPAPAAAAPGGFDFSRAAEMLGGMGGGRGGGAGGGMPDLAGLMNNPQVMQAAQQMMANGGLEQVMNNPMMRNLAQQFMQGQGRGGGA